MRAILIDGRLAHFPIYIAAKNPRRHEKGFAFDGYAKLNLKAIQGIAVFTRERIAADFVRDAAKGMDVLPIPDVEALLDLLGSVKQAGITHLIIDPKAGDKRHHHFEIDAAIAACGKPIDLDASLALVLLEQAMKHGRTISISRANALAEGSIGGQPVPQYFQIKMEGEGPSLIDAIPTHNMRGELLADKDFIGLIRQMAKRMDEAERKADEGK